MTAIAFTTSGVSDSIACGKKLRGRSGSISWPSRRIDWLRERSKRWEDALKRQRQEEEEYDRFMVRQPVTLGPAERERIRKLSNDVIQLWNAEGTSAVDRKQIVRCVVERVILVADRTTELNEVTIVWHGGMATKHQVARPVGSFEQLKDYRRLTERIRELHAAGSITSKSPIH